MAENQNAADQASTLNDERATRLAKRASLFEAGQNPYPEHSEIEDYVVDIETKYAELADGEDTEDVVKIGGRVVAKRGQGKIMFIVVRDGDKLESVASEFRVSPKKLVKYNDLDIHSNVKTGDMIYIRPKAKRSSNGKMIHVARDGETLHSISQMYGIRLKSLCNINRRSRDSQVTEGQQIRLM